MLRSFLILVILTNCNCGSATPHKGLTLGPGHGPNIPQQHPVTP